MISVILNLILETYLIKKQDVGSTHTQDGKRDTGFLTSRKSTNLLNTSKTRDTKRSQMISVILLDLTRELVLQELYSRHGRIQLIDMMLGKVGNSAFRIMVGIARVGLQCTSEKLDEGRFTRSVRTDNGNSRVELNIDIDVFENDLGGCIAESSLVELQERRRQFLGFGEAERLGVVLLGRLEFGQLFQDLDTRLSLRCYAVSGLCLVNDRRTHLDWHCTSIGRCRPASVDDMRAEPRTLSFAACSSPAWSGRSW